MRDAVVSNEACTRADHDNLAGVEDDLSLLEQHAKHVVSLLGRRLGDTESRITALGEASALFREIRQIRDRVHTFRGNHEAGQD